MRHAAADTTSFIVSMPQAAPEDVQRENALYERLTLALTESLTTLSSEDLQKWDLRSALFTNLDPANRRGH
jgi:hypothetical protein